MEKLIDEFFDEPSYEQLNAKWHEKYRNKSIDILEEFKDSKLLNEFLIKIIKYFIEKFNTIKYYNQIQNQSISSSEDIQENFNYIIKEFINSFDFNILPVSDALDLLESFKNIKCLKYLMGLMFKHLLFEMGKNNFYEKFSIDELNRYFQQLEIKLFPLFENSAQNESEEIKIHFERYCSLWRFNLENAVKNINDDQYMKSLSSIQHLFEFSLFNSSNIFDCLYKYLCNAIVRKRSYIQNCPSLYINLMTSGDDTHINKLLDLLKQILIEDKNNFNESALSDFIHEFAYLIKIDPLKPKSLFEKYYKIISEVIFEIFLKTKRNEARLLCRIFYRDIIDILLTMKKHDTVFQKILIIKLNEIAVSMKNSDEISLEYYADFCYWLANYIHRKCDLRSLSLPTLNLAIEWLNLSSNSKFMALAAELLHKDSFFVFIDYTDKLKELIGILINLALTIPEKYSNDEKILREYVDATQKCIERVTKYLEKNTALMTIIQPILLTDLFGKAIIDDIDDEIFYQIIKEFTSIIDFKYIATKKEDIVILKNIVNHAVDPKIIESIQPDFHSIYNFRNSFYLNFFSKLSFIYETRKDLAIELEPEICNLITRIDEFNNYDDPISPGSFTINYRISISFISLIGKNCDDFKSMVSFLLPILIKIYLKHKDLNDVKSQLTSFLNGSVSIKHGDVLANEATQLWKIFLNNKLDYTLPNVLSITLTYNAEAFNDEISSQYFDYIMSDEVTDQILIRNILLLQGITKYCTSRLLEKRSNSNNLVILDLIHKVNKLRDGLLIFYILDLFNKLSNELTNTNILYDLRIEIYKTIFFTDTQNFNDLKNLLSIKGMDITGCLYVLGSGLSNMGTKLVDDKNYSKTKQLVLELILFIKKFTDKSLILMFINCLKEIATSPEKLFLLKEHREFFENIKKNSDGDINQSVIYLCDVIDGRNLENIDQKVNLNTKNIHLLKNDVDKTNEKVDKLNDVVSEQDKEIKYILKDVEIVNNKLDNVDERLVEQDKRIDIIDDKTFLNVPLWAKEISSLLANQWVLIAKRLNFSQNDINSWYNQADPFMAVLQEWYTINKSSEATVGLIKILKEMNEIESVGIIENYLKIAAENVPNEDVLDQELVNSPPQIFFSFQSSIKDKAELLMKYLEKENFSCWADYGQFGGGDARNKRIDKGLRAAHVLVCFVSEDYAKDETCLRQVNLAVTLDKPIVPLLLEKLKWPPAGSLGPILSGYLFVRFYQRPNELTNDERYWPADKLDELLMQLRQVIPSKNPNAVISNSSTNHPHIFISYQWSKQKEIIKLYERLTSFGLTCWLDIKEMSGGDTLYEKIDTGIRNCHVMISCVTEKYAISANCRKEVLLADSINKPIIPLLLDPNTTYPPTGPMGPTLVSLNYIDLTKDLNQQITWKGDAFNELMERLKTHLPDDVVNEIENKIPISVRNSKACILS